MEKVNKTVKAYAQVITFLLIWSAVLLVTDSYSSFDLWTAMKHVPKAVIIYVVIGFLFTKWLWRWKPFQGWLIKIPDLQGTWRGEIKSDWLNPDNGEGIDPIDIVLVIRQTFSSINCTLMTAESSSYSTTADINVVSSNRELYLTYNYTNRPNATIRDRSSIHDGAAILRIINKPKKCLEGEYWTSRKTRGDMKLTFQSRDLVEKF